MVLVKIKVKDLKVTCQRCGYCWHPRVKDVRTCAKCRSVMWDKPRRVEQADVVQQMNVPHYWTVSGGKV